MQTVTKWEREGLPIAERGRKGRPSRYAEKAVRAWLAARERDGNSGGMAMVALERARKERAQAVLAEQLAATRARALVPADEVRKGYDAIVTAVRTKLLAVQTTYIGRLSRAFTLEGEAGLERTVGEVMREVLRELATEGAREAVPAQKASKGRAA